MTIFRRRRRLRRTYLAVIGFYDIPPLLLRLRREMRMGQ
jgi:hypothetical protein